MVIELYSLDDLAKHFERAGKDFDRLDATKPLETCSVLIAADAKENFQRSRDPDGNPWKPLKRPRTLPKSRRKSVKKRRRRTGESDKPLLDTGTLQGSMTGGSSHIRTIANNELKQGTNVAYAIYHQSDKPRKHIPRRAFLGFSEQLISKCETILADFWENAIGLRI